MPKRTDIQHVLVIGSGPIVIGQACEFDYSGTQACRVLRADGLRVTLVNSNPATIMTDPEFADATYIEPITPEFVELVIAKERPDALLATLGGQTALNTAVALHDAGVLDKYGVELIGADIEAIRRGEDRQLFKEIVVRAGGEVPLSRVCHSMDEVHEAVADLGLPVVIRPSFTMGGLGSGMAHTPSDLDRLAGGGLAASPVHEVLVEESVLGWKEFELELMRDRKDNVVVVCSIENLDPMGVHTGDSITVAPAMTLTDREYQRMRDVGIAVLRAVGVDTGGCNIQFAVHPGTGRLVVIEMNPRVSRSSALASKATGFPIAKIAAKLAIGYTLDEIPNDITLKTPACFEPSIDYVVVKIPRWAFEKFPDADTTLGTQMKSVGESMASGGADRRLLRRAKRAGYSDAQIGFLSGEAETGVRARRLALGLAPTFKSVDTCAAEFEALTPYYYSTWEDEDEAVVSPRRSVVILGSGPNRIGQGIEFDYSCVHAAQEIRAAGYDAVMINCNPETVSTDYDTSTRLYFEPLTFEDVMAVLDRERPMGVILTLGGQTPLKLAVALEAAGVPVLGTPPEAIDRAEDRGRFTELLSELGIDQAPGGIAAALRGARQGAAR